MLHGVSHLLEDPDQSPTDQELAKTLRNVKELTGIAEKEMHAVILSCVRARREVLGQSAMHRRTIH